jgi:hypothetical protein
VAAGVGSGITGGFDNPARLAFWAAFFCLRDSLGWFVVGARLIFFAMENSSESRVIGANYVAALSASGRPLHCAADHWYPCVSTFHPDI